LIDNKLEKYCANLETENAVLRTEIAELETNLKNIRRIVRDESILRTEACNRITLLLKNEVNQED